MTLEEHLAVPYLLTTYAAPLADGSWKRWAEYPEIGVVRWADTLVEAMDLLEEERVSYIVERLAHGEPIPVPRPPLRALMAELSPASLRAIEDRLVAHASGNGS